MKISEKDDAVIGAFLSFLATDMANSPQQIKPLDEALAGRIEALVGHLAICPNEDLGEELLV